MGFNPQGGQVGFGIQSVKGTPVAATRFARLLGGALGGKRDLLIPDPEIGGNRDIPGAYMGAVSYGGTYEFYPRMQMLALLAYAALGAKTSTTTGSAGAEVQTVTVNGSPTGGTFTLSYRGQTTSNIAYNAAAAAVQSALEALSTIGSGNVTVSGSAGGPYTVTFAGSLATGDLPALSGNAAGLTGGTSPYITVAQTTQGYSVAGKHVIGTADVLPWLTVEERVGPAGAAFESFQYTDCKVNSLKFEVDPNGYFKGSVDILGLTQVAGFTAQATPAWDQSPLLVGSNASLYWDGVQLPAKAFNFEVMNNIEDNDFRLGTIALGDLSEHRREIKAGFTVRPNDAAIWRTAMNGSPSATTPLGGKAYYGSLKLVLSSYENINATTKYRIEVDMPLCALEPITLNPQGDQTLEFDVNATAVRPDSLTDIVTVTVWNDLSTVS